MSRWRVVPLGEVLTKSNDWVQLDPEHEYKEVTVRNRGQGAVLRRLITGAEVAGHRRLRTHSGEFIVSRIDARHGSTAVIPDDLEGAIVTNDFPVFDCSRNSLLPDYLGWYSKTTRFVDACRRASEGSTNRVRLKEEAFLDIEMPLPSIEEQRRVVEKLNQLAAAAARVGQLQVQVTDNSRALCRSLTARLFGALARECDVKRLRDLDAYVTSGPRSWSQYYSDTGERFYRAQDIGRDGTMSDGATQHLIPPAGSEGRHARVAPGDVLIVITGATVGRVALVHPSHESGFVSQHVALCRVASRVLEPEYLANALLAPGGQHQLLESRYGQGKPGLNLNNVLDFRLPVPSVARQQEVVAELAALRARSRRLDLQRGKAVAGVDRMMLSVLSSAFGTAD